jgi:amidase
VARQPAAGAGQRVSHAWNLAGYPALSVPAGRHPSGVPIGVQLVAPPGGEPRLLALAGQLEKLRAR